jgi:hypothetical protein
MWQNEMAKVDEVGGVMSALGFCLPRAAPSTLAMLLPQLLAAVSQNSSPNQTR